MDKNYFSKYFHFNKILLHCCGVLPIETGILNAFSIILPFCSVSFLALPAFYTFVFRESDFETAMEVFSPLLEGIAATFKAMLLLSKRKRLANLVFLCNSLWKNVKDENEAEAAKVYAKRGMYFTYGFFFIVMTAFINVLLQSAFEKFLIDSNGTLISSRTLPYPTGLFHENIQIFNIWYLMQVPAGIVIVIEIVAIDTAVVVFILHACAHFNILQFRILKLKQLYEEDHRKKESKEISFGEIVKIVKFHQDILQYCAAVEEIFNPVVLLQTVLSITAVCIFGINFVLKDEDILNQVIHFGGSIFQLFMFCWPPNSLQTESFNVSMKTYELPKLPWYNWPRREKKLVEIMIFRSQKFAIISAGKFALMSLRTFTSILSSAYSFFTLLRRLL